VTIDASNDPRGDHPLEFGDRERDEIEALRRRFERDSPQAFTDSDASRFERITGTLGVPAFPITREAVLDIVRANHGADSVLAAVKSLPEGARYDSYDQLLLALGIGSAGRIDVPGAPPRDPEGGAPSLPR
jgi:hypothetical protein